MKPVYIIFIDDPLTVVPAIAIHDTAENFCAASTAEDALRYLSGAALLISIAIPAMPSLGMQWTTSTRSFISASKGRTSLLKLSPISTTPSFRRSDI